MSSIGSYTHDNLLAGDHPLVTFPATILSGESVVRGQIMGKITASGKYRACNANLVDGAQTADAIMAEDIDASASDLPGIVYLTGQFNTNQVSISTAAGADTVAAHYTELRLRSIFLEGQVSVLGTIS